MGKPSRRNEVIPRPSESALRSRAKARGYSIRKARGQTNINNHGGYQIMETDAKCIVAGKRFDLSLEDVDRFLQPADTGEEL